MNQSELRRVALGAVLALPFFLFYGRAIAEGLMALVDVLFLARCAMARDWVWARQVWVWLAGAIWVLQLISSLMNGPAHSALEALVLIRVFVFVAAVQVWVLADAPARRALGWVILALAVWAASQCWEQFLTGHNWLGYPRWPDGALTGPFIKPRCGEIFLFVALPGLMPVVLGWISGVKRWQWGAGVLVLMASLTTMILIGQRMPNVLFLLGLCITGLLVRRFRAPLGIALAVGVVAVAMLPLVSPPTFHKLVIHFIQQMSHFWGSPYGQLYTRASVMIAARPWTGWGFEGFKDFCGRPAFFHGWPGLGIPDAVNGGLAGCNLHPHNYYMQVGTMAGVPGLLLFVALAVVWLREIGARLDARADALRAMVFVTCCVIFWPIASTSGLFTPDTSGWVFLMTGWGLAFRRDVAMPLA